MTWWRKLLLTLGIGYVLFFFSESLFWARFKPDDTLPGMVLGWLLYSLCGFILIMLVDHFRIRDFWGLFLAGGLFGWLVEGVVVQTVYEELPWSIVFTALSWHGLISVIVGVFILRRALVSWPWWGAVLLSLGMGAVEGFWAIWWWLEAPAATPNDYLLFIGFGTLALILWSGLMGLAGTGRFGVHRRGRIAAAVVIGLVFLVVGFFVPVAFFVLPPLVLLTLAALSRQTGEASNQDLFAWYGRPVKWANLLSLVLFPLAAAGIYTLAYRAEIRFPTHQVVYVLTSLTSLILWLVGLVKSFEKGEHPAVRKG